MPVEWCSFMRKEWRGCFSSSGLPGDGPDDLRVVQLVFNDMNVAAMRLSSIANTSVNRNKRRNE
jgi:hypothetical protein